MNCNLCPVCCNVDRTQKVGACGVSDKLRIAKYYLHKFEEPCISGTNGSGTIFFCGCCLRCVFCQNYELSRNTRGKDITVNELIGIIRELESAGAHNINLVTPTQYSDKIMTALKEYRPKIPVVYNTHGYEKAEVIERLFPYVNVFLPDLKFFSPTISKRYTGKSDYFKVAFSAVRIMAEKPVIFDENGLMKSGTIVRHLVLPACVSDSKKVLDAFCEIKDKAYINVMSQYTPLSFNKDYPELNRKITKREYDSVLEYAISLGIKDMFYQKMSSADKKYIPKWDF